MRTIQFYITIISLILIQTITYGSIINHIYSHAQSRDSTNSDGDFQPNFEGDSVGLFEGDFKLKFEGDSVGQFQQEEQKQYWQFFMLQLVREFDELSDKKNCTGAMSYLSSTGYFAYPYNVDPVFSRDEWGALCEAEGKRVTSSYSIGDTAAEETHGFLVYQFDMASVVERNGEYSVLGMKGIGIAGFTGFYKINIVSGYYDGVTQANASDVRMFIFSVLTALERGDCDAYSASFTRNGEYMHDAVYPVIGRSSIRASCRDYVSTFESFTLTIEEVYVNGDGAAAYWHLTAFDEEGMAYISNTFSFFAITPAMKIEKMYDVNDIYTEEGTIL